MKYNSPANFFIAVVALSVFGFHAHAQETLKEEDFFQIKMVPTPEDALLEVGGLATMPNGNLAVSTRRGDIFIIENPTSPNPYFRTFATGLHEVLGIVYKDNAFYCAQRGELTRLSDTNQDGKADKFETVYAWPLTGNYHEYSYGPEVAPDGSFFVTTNLGFFPGEWWRGRSEVPWRGWALRIYPDGRMQPWATGMRSPCGPGIIDGEFFYTENQGDWIGSGGLWHLEEGDFVGNPGGLAWSDLPESPVDLTLDYFHSKIDPRRTKDAEGKYIRPQNIKDEKVVTMSDLKKEIPQLRLPAVWLPHGVLGVSNAQPLSIPPGHFGPFEGQVLVGDQGMSIISRVFLEKVKGEYQGAAFAFRSGFASGVTRMAWAKDGSLFIGETNRGWRSAGTTKEGLERLVWNNKIPLEMKAVRAMPDGFEIEFTQPVDRASAEDLASYKVESFLYKYHPAYGSPPVNVEACNVKGVQVSDDGMKARIIVDNLRRAYIHTITLPGVREKTGSHALLHPTAYYTLNHIPEGDKLSLDEVSTKNSSLTSGNASAKKDTPPAKTEDKPDAVKTPSYLDVKGLLTNYTCVACHHATNKQIGPPFREIAKRNYPAKKIVDLIHSPQPQNWPDYATAMPPMPHVAKEDALKIAAWINSLE